MAEDKKETAIEVALFGNLDMYLELYKLVEAFKKVDGHGLDYGVSPDKIVEGRIQITGDEFVELIQDNYLKLGYKSVPSSAEIIKALENASNLSGEKDWGKALKILQANPALIKSSYKKFKEQDAKNLETSQENVKESKTSVKANRKENRKQKRRRFWAGVGKVVTATLTAALAGGFLFGVFSLAGGFAGLASISTMPFVTLSIVGGVIGYRLVKAAVSRIWKGLTNVINKANAVIKGDSDVLGSTKSLKNAKTLAKQNTKALNLIRSRQNAHSVQNYAAYNELESLLENSSIPDIENVIDLGEVKSDKKAEISEILKEKEKDGDSTPVAVNNSQEKKDDEIVVNELGNADENGNKVEEQSEENNNTVVEVSEEGDSLKKEKDGDSTFAADDKSQAKKDDEVVVKRENTFFGYKLPKEDKEELVNEVVEEITKDFDGKISGTALVEVKEKVKKYFENNSKYYKKNPESIVKQVKVQVFEETEAKNGKATYYITTTSKEVEKLIKEVEKQSKIKNKKAVVTRVVNGEPDDLTITGFEKTSATLSVEKMVNSYRKKAKDKQEEYKNAAKLREQRVEKFSKQTKTTNSKTLVQAVENALSIKLYGNGREIERDANGMHKNGPIFDSLVKEVTEYAENYYSGKKMKYVKDYIKLMVPTGSGKYAATLESIVKIDDIDKAYNAILQNQEFNFVELAGFKEICEAQKNVTKQRVLAGLDKNISDTVKLDEIKKDDDYKVAKKATGELANKIYNMFGSDKEPTEAEIRELYATNINNKNIDIVSLCATYKTMLEKLATVEKIEKDREGFGEVVKESDQITLKAAIKDYVESINITEPKKATEIEEKIYSYFVEDLFEKKEVKSNEEAQALDIVDDLPKLESITVKDKDGDSVEYGIAEIKKGVNEHLEKIIIEQEKNSSENMKNKRGKDIDSFGKAYYGLFENAQPSDYTNFVYTTLPKILTNNGITDENDHKLIMRYLADATKDETDIFALPENVNVSDIVSYTKEYVEAERRAEKERLEKEQTEKVEAENAKKAAILEQNDKRTKHKKEYSSSRRGPTYKKLDNESVITTVFVEMANTEDFKGVLKKYCIGVGNTDWNEIKKNYPEVINKLVDWFTAKAEKDELFDNKIKVEDKELDLEELEKTILVVMEKRLEKDKSKTDQKAEELENE